MARTTIAAIGAATLAGALLCVPPAGAPALERPSLTVIENRSVVLGAGVEVKLGSRVEALGAGFSLEAYSPGRRSGTVQWHARSGAPVLLLVSDGLVKAISVAFEPGFRTQRGVGLGDPMRRLRATYGSKLFDAAPLARAYALYPGFALGDPAGAVTYFDTSCTGRVNGIALTLGSDGLRALGDLWRPSDASVSCAPVD